MRHVLESPQIRPFIVTKFFRRHVTMISHNFGKMFSWHFCLFSFDKAKFSFVAESIILNCWVNVSICFDRGKGVMSTLMPFSCFLGKSRSARVLEFCRIVSWWRCWCCHHSDASLSRSLRRGFCRLSTGSMKDGERK